jgi:hypothetical protein
MPRITNEERDYSPAEARWLAGNKEVSMSSKYLRCPGCGAVNHKDDFEDAELDDAQAIGKAFKLTHDSIVEEFRKRMPTASSAEVLSAAVNSPEYMKLHQQEKNERFKVHGY